MTIDSADVSKISNRTITTNRISNWTYDSKSNRITKLHRSLAYEWYLDVFFFPFYCQSLHQQQKYKTNIIVSEYRIVSVNADVRDITYQASYMWKCFVDASYDSGRFGRVVFYCVLTFLFKLCLYSVFKIFISPHSGSNIYNKNATKNFTKLIIQKNYYFVHFYDCASSA